MLRVVCLVSTLLAASCASTPAAMAPVDASLRIVSWNMEHLAAADGSGCRPRTEVDYAALRAMVQRLDADFEHIVRLKHWADLYLHEGVRDFAWAPARAIAFLRPFLVGGAVPHGLSVDAGFQIKRAAFDEMRAELKKDNEDELYELPLWPSDQCAVVFI